MQKYINNVQDTLGNAIGSVTVTIRDVPGGALSTIFSDNSGTTKTNPFTNDPDGEFFFYAANGRYDIDLTGPVTESFSDVRLLDISATGNTIRINTDIATATPPTTENVTGFYAIYDLDNDDELMRLGFEGFPNISFNNNMRGGLVVCAGKNSGGTGRVLWHGDPDFGFNAYFKGTIVLKCADSTDAGQISGAEVIDGFGTFRPVGLGVSRQRALSGTGTQTYFTQAGAGATIYWTGGSATNIDTFASTGADQTDIPDGAWWVVQNNGAGALTLRGGASVTIRHWDGLGSAPPDEDVVVPRGALALIRKVSNTVYDFSHNG